VKLFAYGTLLEPDIQIAIIGRVVNGIPDCFAGYRKMLRQFISGIYPDLEDDLTGHVDGKVLELTAEELERCDEYEGSEYKKNVVKLTSGAEVFVYRGV